MNTFTVELAGVVGVVTGASRGAGRAVAIVLAEAGATVYPHAVARRSPPRWRWARDDEAVASVPVDGVGDIDDDLASEVDPELLDDVADGGVRHREHDSPAAPQAPLASVSEPLIAAASRSATASVSGATARCGTKANPNRSRVDERRA
jgi:NAD(P)-dependent dehydrogenase (short-subunit alcohol dehydrogenase family)